MIHELNQQIQADDLELEQEQLVAKTKNETNKSEKEVAMEIKKCAFSQCELNRSTKLRMH